MEALLIEIAAALNRIADALERFEPDVPAPCPHPASECEVMPGSTLGHVTHRCKACGEEGVTACQ
jgi:hypothetical protein